MGWSLCRYDWPLERVYKSIWIPISCPNLHWSSNMSTWSYPCYQCIIQDGSRSIWGWTGNRNEFLWPAFTKILQKNMIKSLPTTVKHPQGNAIVERVHQSISTMIAISLKENPPHNFEEVSNLIHRKYMALSVCHKNNGTFFSKIYSRRTRSQQRHAASFFK